MRDAHRQAFGPDALYSCTWKWLDSVRAYGQACATTEEGMARVVWAPDSKSVRLGQHTVELSAMKTMMRMAIEDMNTSLRQLISQCSAPLDPNQFPLESLVDDPTWSAPGASFTTLEANANMLHPEMFGDDMMPKIMENNGTEHNSEGVSNKVTLKVNDETWEYVEELEKKFLLAAVLAIHMTSGMPCRAEELTEATIMDSAGARPRSFVLGTNGDVFLHLTYNKSEWATSRKNLRLLHPAVGRMWAFYLAMMRPTLDACFQVKNKINRTYAWCKAPSTEGETPAKWRGDTIAEAMGNLATRAGLGFRLNVSTMRHFAEAVCHKFFRADVLDTNTDEANTASNLIAMGYEPGNEEEEHAFRDALDNVNRGNAVAGPSTPRSQDAFSAQSGRTLDNGWRLYARVIHHRAGINDGIIARARLASLTWQSFWTLSDVVVAFNTPDNPKQRAIEASSVFSPTPSEVFPTPTRSVVSVPSSPTLIDMDSDKLKTMIRDAVNTGVATALAQQHVPPTTATIPAAPDALQSVSTRIPLSVDDVKAMFKLHNTGTERKWNYNGVRSTAVADTMVHVSSGVTHVGCVAPCGAGKTDVIFMAILKAIEKKGMMVLIVPYRAAIKDLLNKLAARKITAVEWINSLSVFESRSEPAAVVITLERASVRKFPQLTTLLKERHWSFLSATIPPRLEKEFQNMVMLPVVFYRELTHRTNIVYSHQRYTSRQQLVIQLKDLIRKVTTGPGSSQDDQVLILTKSKNDALAYATALGVEAYFTTDEHDGAGAASRDPHFFDFFVGKTKVLVATPAASSSWDKPTVRCVAFIDGPYTVTTYAQTEGRVCRDGRRGNVVIYQREEKKYPASIGPMIPTTDAEALKMLLSDTVCMRIPIGAWLDGRPTTCFELAGEMCSVCACTLGTRHTGISSNPYPDSSDSDGDDSEDEYWRDLDFDNADLDGPFTQEKGKGKARAPDKAGNGHTPGPRSSNNNTNIGSKRGGPPLDNVELKRARAATGRANVPEVTLPRAAVLRAALQTLDGDKGAKPKPVPSTAPAPTTPANKYKRVSPGQRWNWGSYTDPTLLVSSTQTPAGLSTEHLRAQTNPGRQTSWPMDSDSEDEDSRPVFLPPSPGTTVAEGGSRDASGQPSVAQTQLAVRKSTE
ncbi:unnamed protein product [Tilletia controversa]|nr:unnamed protein product [Tilletia controversa]